MWAGAMAHLGVRTRSLGESRYRRCSALSRMWNGAGKRGHWLVEAREGATLLMTDVTTGAEHSIDFTVPPSEPPDFSEYESVFIPQTEVLYVGDGGSKLLVAMEDCRLILGNALGNNWKALPNPPFWAFCACFSPSGLLLVGEACRRTAVWDAQKGYLVGGARPREWCSWDEVQVGDYNVVWAAGAFYAIIWLRKRGMCLWDDYAKEEFRLARLETSDLCWREVDLQWPEDVSERGSLHVAESYGKLLIYNSSGTLMELMEDGKLVPCAWLDTAELDKRLKPVSFVRVFGKDGAIFWDGYKDDGGPFVLGYIREDNTWAELPMDFTNTRWYLKT